MRKIAARVVVGLGIALAGMFGLAGTIEAAAAANLKLSPELKDFGAVKVGSQSAPSTFTVRVSGTGVATINAVSLTGDAPEQYSLVTDGCTSKSLTTTKIASCEIVVRFRPEERGNHRATLQVESDAGPPQRSYFLGSAVAAAGLGMSPDTGCRESKKHLKRARTRVRQLNRKLRHAGSASKRQAIRRRLASQKQKVKRLETAVTKRCA
jgi:hypothetical protein